MQTYTQQVQSHIDFLRSNGLDVESLEVDHIVRCCEIGKENPRGELAYRCSLNEMDKGYVGLVTWCRGTSGKEATHKTYGMGPSGEAGEQSCVATSAHVKEEHTQEQKEAARRSYGFWENSSLSGLSSYLEERGVGAYGIRFRSSEEYGNVAVVPMLDEQGWLWSYQLLNADGSKRMPKGARTRGLFHALQKPVNGEAIGIAESYVTAATCFELSGVSTVCCFSSSNMLEAAQIIRKLYPRSPLVLFADNDRHLEFRGLPNKGVLMASGATKAVEACAGIAAPDFGDLEPSKDVSDWNDLVRLRGFEFAKEQIGEKCTAFL